MDGVRLLGAVAVLGTAGCSFVPDALSPAEWYKDVREAFRGSKTEAQRAAEAAARGTPIPGANGPFPNLATVPPRPMPPDEPATQVIDRLTEDRMGATRADAELRERAAREALPAAPVGPTGSASLPIPQPAPRATPPPALRLVRPPPPPELRDPSAEAQP